jgi:hypothetical protein
MKTLARPQRATLDRRFHRMGHSTANVAVRATIKQVEMRLRARMPGAARLVYRFVRSFQPVVPSKYLPDDLVRDCRFCSSRLAMLDFLPRNGYVEGRLRA